MITSGIALLRQMNQTMWLPLFLSVLAKAYADAGQQDEATFYIDEAITTLQTTGERWCEADTHRIAGEVVLLSPVPDTAKAETYFKCSLSVARQQQAKSWELRTAMSLARLWRDQGKVQQRANCLLRFTDGSRRGSTRAI
jgi:predicted ATPase